jgi:hypothetical protein
MFVYYVAFFYSPRARPSCWLGPQSVLTMTIPSPDQRQASATFRLK